MIRLLSTPFDPHEALRAFSEHSGPTGAVASFIGHVRGEAGAVTTLELEHYPGFTETVIAAMEHRARERFSIVDTLIIHRYGRLAPGEPIVLAAASAAHRKDALLAVDYMMDHLKTDAPFWKREVGPEGARWIEPRDADTRARRTWDQETAP